MFRAQTQLRCGLTPWSLVNETISRQANWLPDLIDSEDAMRGWEANTAREKVLRLYKFLNQLGYTVIAIDAGIERERTKNDSTE